MYVIGTSKPISYTSSGPSLIELLDHLVLERKFDGPLMMPIADKFKDMGTIVIGKIESGWVKKGQTVMIMPNKVFLEIDN